MIAFSNHNRELRKIFYTARKAGHLPVNQLARSSSGIDLTLRNIVEIKEMRAAGVFFTGDELAKDVFQGFKSEIKKHSKVLDPTCGCGNLLIHASSFLDVNKSLNNTITEWSKVLHGYDLYSEFVECTKIRLILEAIHRGSEIDLSLGQAIKKLKNIKAFNAKEINFKDLAGISHIVMNPPFSMWKPENTEIWKTGKVNAAALVFEWYLKYAPEECQFSAILPEVLRSGTRYQEWRNLIEQSLQGKVKTFGRFNNKTDVDVFTLHGQKKINQPHNLWRYRTPEKVRTIENNFKISVGPLVAYRSPLVGPKAPYLHPRNTPAWATIYKFDELRQYSGRLIKPPFVVIRRTSRPGDRHRATGSIVIGTEEIAVENHLIVAEPKNRALSECNKLVKLLKTDYCNDFLNDRIRCRHLTVQSVKEIPYG